jgi:hypothetical protein
MNIQCPTKNPKFPTMEIVERGPVSAGIHLYEVRLGGSVVASFEDDPNCSKDELIESALAAVKEKGIEV